MENPVSDGFPHDFDESLMRMLEEDDADASNMGVSSAFLEAFSDGPLIDAGCFTLNTMEFEGLDAIDGSTAPDVAVNSQLPTVAESAPQDASNAAPLNVGEPTGADPIGPLSNAVDDMDCQIIETRVALPENAFVPVNSVVAPMDPQFNVTHGAEHVNNAAGSPQSTPVAMRYVTAPMGQANLPYLVHHVNAPAGSPENANMGINYGAAPMAPQFLVPYGAQPMSPPIGSPQNSPVPMGYVNGPMGPQFIMPYGAQPMMNANTAAGSPGSAPMPMNHVAAPMGYQANVAYGPQQMLTPTASPEKTVALSLPLTPASKKKTERNAVKKNKSRANGSGGSSVLSNHKVLNNIHLPAAIATPEEYANHVSPFSPIEPAGPTPPKTDSLRSIPTSAQNRQRVQELAQERSRYQRALRRVTNIDPETGKTELQTVGEENGTLRRVNTTQSNVNKKLKQELTAERQKFADLAKQYNDMLFNLQMAQQENMDLKCRLGSV